MYTYYIHAFILLLSSVNWIIIKRTIVENPKEAFSMPNFCMSTNDIKVLKMTKKMLVKTY